MNIWVLRFSFSWTNSVTIIMDGNFKQEHMKSKSIEPDVSLSDGAAFLVNSKDYKEYLDSTADDPEVRGFDEC